MKYFELKLSSPQLVEDENIDIYIADLGEIGFESFTSEDGLICAYINEGEYATFKPQVDEFIAEMTNLDIKCEFSKAEEQNWNELWESNFEPIYIEDRCCIRAPFHNKSECELEVIIMPKMSFGTGHHATTYLMVEKILDSDFSDFRGLDMGTGTGVLAIVALMKGAEYMCAIDIDEWAEDNCRENIATNNFTDKMKVICGDAGSIPDEKYDFILANINRNILINDMASYTEHLSAGGSIYFSGFLSPDVEDIIEKANSLGMTHVETRSKDGWQLVHVRL
ncbi:MAG: 50S ribosomal protein L11 methyltransferase [Rikenellaceae bacterium]